MKLENFNQEHLESTKKNGWKLYEKPEQKEIVAFMRWQGDGEQLIFGTEKSFANWIEAEHNER